MFNFAARSLVSANLHRKQLSRFQQFDTFFRCQLGRRISCCSPTNMTRSGGSGSKPPNILVYAELEPVRRDLVATLQRNLVPDRYTVYPVTVEQVEARAWPDSTALLVVHGRLEQTISEVFLDYFLGGGKLLSVCSDLSEVLDCGEVRGVEDVVLNYGTWKEVQVKQEIRDGGVKESTFAKVLKDLKDEDHELRAQVIAREDTNHTVSILLADDLKTCGRFISTQIVFVPFEDNKLNLEIFRYLLNTELGIQFKTSHSEKALSYQSAYLIGNEGIKRNFLSTLPTNKLKVSDLTLEFCSNSDITPTPSESHLPVLTSESPQDFSTELYHRHLKTSKIGQLSLYLPVVSSSMIIVSNATLPHGFTAIPRRQTNGTGRNANQWLSPAGCAMFSLQLHIGLDTPLGQRLPMVQHLVALGIVLGIRGQPGYSDLDVRLKWPNDIYAHGRTKLGGIIVNSVLQGTMAIVNVGCGVNLSNSTPTTCVNDVIKEYNQDTGSDLDLIGYEQLLAQIFNEIERIFDQVQRGNVQLLYDLYGRYWLHGGKSVTVRDRDGKEVTGTVAGIDEYGYLLVKVEEGGEEPICVHPDGNSFDMMKGLIIPKHC